MDPATQTATEPEMELGAQPEQFSAQFQIKKADLQTREFEAWASVFNHRIDAFVPTVIEPGAFKKTIAGKKADRIKILWQHRIDEPIGFPLKEGGLDENDKGLLVRGRISETGRGRDALALMRDAKELGKPLEFSIGFTPVKFRSEKVNAGKKNEEELRYLEEIDLHEISFVTMGADMKALLREVNQRHDRRAETLAVVSFQDLPLADRGRSWDASAAEGRIRSWAGGPKKDDVDFPKYRRAFVWYDRGNAEEFGSYKLPVADVIDGRLSAVPRAIFAAGAALQGARGGVDIPSSDKAAARTHLGRYYKKLDAKPPWERSELLPEELEVFGSEEAATIAELFQGGSQIQTIVFPKSKWTLEKARQWLRDHDFKVPAVDDTPNSYRFRQRDPDDFERIRPFCLTPRGAEPTLEKCRVLAFGGPLKERRAGESEDREVLTLTFGEVVGPLLDELKELPVELEVESTELASEPPALSETLNNLLASRVSKELTREELIWRIGRAGGMSSASVRQVLDGELHNVPRPRLCGFARALGVSASRLERDAASNGDEGRSGETHTAYLILDPVESFAGRVLSTKNLSRIRQVVDLLNELLKSAEGDTEGKKKPEEEKRSLDGKTVTTRLADARLAEARARLGLPAGGQ